jgi:glycosyltransferase involved in cell wall biosynthesis
MVGALFVGNFLSEAGVHRHYCEELVERLRAREWNIVETSTRSGRFARLIDMLRSAWSHRRDYRVAHIDVFSGAAFVWAEAVCAELARLGKPYVLTLRGGNLPAFSRKWPRRVSRLLASAAVVTAPSHYLRDALATHRRDITVLPNALDVERYPFTVRARPHPTLVWLRAFHRVYNPKLAVDVVAELAAKHPDISLTMVGPDKGDGSTDEVRRYAIERGVSERVQLVGRIAKADVPKQLAGGDIFLNTTDIDNTPISVLEAMSCGMCVVSTTAGGMPYLVDHGKEGLLVPQRDVSAMVSAVDRILCEPTLAASLSQGARAKALQCDWSHVLPRWEQLLSEVADA